MPPLFFEDQNGNNKAVRSGIPLPVSDFWTEHAINEILVQYGDDVSYVEKGKSLLKFGRNLDLGTSFETVWTEGGNETYVSTNVIDAIVSSDAGDAEEITVEGHTIDGNGDFTFIVQNATLNGQTPVSLTTGLARVGRMFNANGTEISGTVYAYEDDDTVTAGVPQTAAKIHCTIPAGSQQSFKAATTFSSVDYALMTYFYADVRKKTSAQVDFEVQIRLKDKVFRARFDRTTGTNSSGVDMDIKPYLIVPPNADVRVAAAASTTGVEVHAGFNAILASIRT